MHSDYNNWEDKKLEDLGDCLTGLTYSPDNISDEGILVLRSPNIKNNEIVLNDTVYVNLEVKQHSISRIGDILICSRNGSKNLIGKNSLIKKSIPIATHGAFMIMFRSEFPDYIAQWMKSESYKKQVQRNLGARINSINAGELNKFKIKIPQSLEEQQKIATFLSTVDSQIEETEREIEMLKEWKKGLMQKMFV